ncbi:hypothetical protein OHS70_20470 [Streptomyces sp. NBC_00390]|uniref:hypothetical protein n=1 Tax=Streptomyces sp. NBC_00390 TaxID=2975736 RepID=UPI002E24DAFD
MDNETEIVIISTESTYTSEAICVIRCLSGTARVGTTFDTHPASGRVIELTEIEWYGHKVDTLDEMHSGKAHFVGTGAEQLRKYDVLKTPQKE